MEIATKKCAKCLEIKPGTEYHKKSKSPDGLYNYCKPCKKNDDRLTYLKTKEKRIEKANEYYEKNKEKILQRIKTEEFRTKKRTEYADNIEKRREYKKQYRINNKDKILKQAKEQRKRRRDKDREYTNNRRKNNPIFRLISNLRKGVKRVLISKGQHKIDSYTKSIGCTAEQLKRHIEAQFEQGMSWDNYGTYWNIDHKIPLSNGFSEEKIYELNHYTNLKPMVSSDNFAKGKNASECWQYQRRLITKQEDIDTGFRFDLTPKDFILNKEVYTSEHRKFIERYEWLGNIGYGTPEYIFTARWEGKLAGIVMMNYPNTAQFGELEMQIQRGACSSWAPKNLNSKLVMFACRWMVKNTKYRIFTAYSDFEAGEIGTIYQACNFDYLGDDYGSRFKYIDDNGKEISERYFNRTSTWKKYAKELNIEWLPEWSTDTGYKNLDIIPEDIKQTIRNKMKEDKRSYKKIKCLPKGKYVLLLKANNKEQIQKTWEALPYPKRNKSE